MPRQLQSLEVHLLELNTECEGWFSLSAFKVDDRGEEIPGSRHQPVPPFRNLITDSGLDRMGTNADWLSWCQVGAGATGPSVGDTALSSRLAATSTIQVSSLTAQPAAPYYVARTNTYRFPAGAAAGNLSEVGVGWGSTGSLFSRALILDALGSPTTITVLADELLDVTYQFRQYTPSVDSAFNLTLGGIVHSVVSRAANVNDSSGDNWAVAQTGTSASNSAPSLSSARQGPIGVETSTPAGTASGSNSTTPSPYTAASHYMDITAFWGNPQGNLPGGIGAFLVKMGIGLYQFGFTPKIMKTADDTLSLTFRHSWSRKIL